MNVTSVRLRNPIPTHCRVPGIDEAQRVAAAGRTIRILLPPIAPSPDMLCDAERVWRIHPEDAIALGATDGLLTLCEHQAELD